MQMLDKRAEIGRLCRNNHKQGRIRVGCRHESEQLVRGPYGRIATTGLNPSGGELRLGYNPVVLLQNLSQAIARKCHHCVTFYPGHRLSGDHSIDNRFFGGLHRRQEKRVDLIVGQHAERANTVGRGCSRIRSGKSNEDVT